MKGTSVLLWCAVFAASLALLGCGGVKDPSSFGAKHNKLFASADPQVKASWESAMAALKTNGYALAIMSLVEINQGTNTAVTPEQVKAANETATAVSDKMYDAANKGDAGALEALEELRKLRRR